jgi:site-specific DNA-methyltransferase (adenine-specific)
LDDLIINEVKGFTDDDAVPDKPKKPKSKLGEIYQLGHHRLMCGDATKEEDINKLMDGTKADMVFNDPPYGIFLNTDFTSMIGIGKGKKYNKMLGDNDDFDFSLITKILEYFNYCKEVFFWGADYYAEIIPKRNDGCFIVWDKMGSGDAPNDNYDKMFGSNFELCWSKTKHKRAIVRCLWKGIFGLSKEDTKKRVHPTQKPTEVCIWFINKFSNKNDIIVDVYGGSGSTLIACEKINRNCYMMELDPSYVDVIIKRWEDYTGKSSKKI